VTESTLKIKVDSTDVKTGKKSLDDLAKSGKDADKSTKDLTSSSDILANSVKALAASYAVLKLVQYAKDAALLAARYETMGIVMRVAGNTAGYTSQQMSVYTKELEKNGISMLQSRNAIVQLATANIDLSKASELGRAAQNLAVVANINSSDAMARMIRGIKSGEVETLKTMGLNVSFENSYKSMAAQLGINTQELTQQQKVMARTNAVLSESASFNGIYEESMTTAGKAMNSLARHSENFKIKLGEIFLPALSDGVFRFTEALKAANKELDEAGSAGTVEGIGGSLATAFKFVTNIVITLSAHIAETFGALGRMIGGFIAQIQALASLDFEKIGLIQRQIIEDNEAGAKAVAAFTREIWLSKDAQEEKLKVSEEERISNGLAAKATMKKAEADQALIDVQRGKADELEKLITGLQEENDLLGKNRVETEIYAAVIQGATAADILRIAAIVESTQAKQAVIDANIELAKSEETATSLLEQQTEGLSNYIDDLESEGKALKMNTRDQAMYNAELDALAYGAGPKAVQTVRELAGANYDLSEATKQAERALNDAARASERAHRQMQQDFSRSMDRFGSTFADLVLEGDNAFDALAKSWERMLIEMAGQEIFKTLLGDSPTFNVQGSSGSAASSAASGATNSLVSGAAGGVTSAAMAAVAFEATQLASLFSSTISGIVGANSMIAPGAAVGAAGAGVGASITAALAAIPVYGWALIAAGAAVAILNNDDGLKRENAGMLVGNTPGADPNKTFAVDPFASGLNVTGIARRASQQQAIEVIDTFRDIDFAFTEMIKSLKVR